MWWPGNFREAPQLCHKALSSVENGLTEIGNFEWPGGEECSACFWGTCTYHELRDASLRLERRRPEILPSSPTVQSLGYQNNLSHGKILQQHRPLRVYPNATPTFHVIIYAATTLVCESACHCQRNEELTDNEHEDWKWRHASHVVLW